ncbi:hypothetical protein HXX76_007980 [Chlamydomonas incerta]|uniref:Glycosyltransferase n=1 Tax=Chlamydomonas incerta TaxID=51695 RepID=A0A835TA01_CHLIN|nr:hypothetical protein HXX76_007980 [Chlamydomonas incerta]|eukprot:KAG2434255.1 hypothetical protein HXX76_007980 [Chlamydomonas incerta]
MSRRRPTTRRDVLAALLLAVAALAAIAALAALRRSGSLPLRLQGRAWPLAEAVGGAVAAEGPEGEMLPPLPSGANATIFVSIGAYRDSLCGGTLESLFAAAARPQRVFVGAVAYVRAGGSGGAGERCEAPGPLLAPHEGRIRRLVLDASRARGPTLARHQAAALYGGQDYLLQVAIDSHMNFTAGWDEQLLRMAATAPTRRAVFTHYPASVEDTAERRVPVMCGAAWLPHEGMVGLTAALGEVPQRGAYRPVPFAAGGFMFAPAAVMKEVPYDPTLDFLFHGEEYLYSARLWTSGWALLTPDANVAFHHYGRLAAPKYWQDFEHDPDYHRKHREVLQRVQAIMAGQGPPGYRYGMGTARSLAQWWEYAGMDPGDRSRLPDPGKFCGGRVFHAGPQPWGQAQGRQAAQGQGLRQERASSDRREAVKADGTRAAGGGLRGGGPGAGVWRPQWLPQQVRP